MNKEKVVFVFGKQYNSISEVARAFSMNESTLHSRINRGKYKSIEEALVDPIKDRKPGKRISINGREYESLAAACRAKQISYNAVSQRLQKGATIEDAFRKVKPGKIKTTIDGYEYDSIKAACRAKQISYSMVG